MRYQAARQMDLFEMGMDSAGITGGIPKDVDDLCRQILERERDRRTDAAIEREIERENRMSGRILIDDETGLRLGDSTRCAICGKEHGLHKHHIFFGTANRQLSEEDGMVVYLCPDCHEHGARAVHRNRETDVALKQAAERVWMADRDADEDAFRARYGRSWL